MKGFAAFFILLWSDTSGVTEALRGSASNDAGSSAKLSARQLQDDGIKDFVPLACNANLATATCNSWSTVIGKAASYTNRVVIPCGNCVTMDLASSSLTLQGGLDVLGKLVFLDGYKLTLSSTMIAVQGELDITASKSVDGSPNVKFVMIGNDDKMTFTPIDTNALNCNGTSTCAIGKKGIVVAGGKLNSKNKVCKLTRAAILLVSLTMSQSFPW